MHPAGRDRRPAYATTTTPVLIGTVTQHQAPTLLTHPSSCAAAPTRLSREDGLRKTGGGLSSALRVSTALPRGAGVVNVLDGTAEALLVWSHGSPVLGNTCMGTGNGPKVCQHGKPRHRNC